ncbi:MAG TPA: response regulator [Kofleriaceae bacterium]|nr:response regulator [Kofleriaceae bacterium]
MSANSNSPSSLAIAESFGELTPSIANVTQAIPAGVRVLVADDEPQVRRVVASALRRLGFEVRTADDGAAAIALAEQTPFDLALVDLGMPTGGLEVVRRLKSLYGQAIHVEILSGHGDQEIRLEAYDAGTDGFLVKPISINELQKRVGAAARAQQAYIAARQAREQADRLLAWGTEAAALLAHDLNNGLAIALSNMTYLSQVLQVTGDDEQALAATVRALRRMSGLVANFVDVSRFEEDALRPRHGKVKIRELLLEVMGVHTPSMTRGIRHSVSCEQDMIGNFDEALIARVLHNLVGNAVRYCNPGGMIRISATEVLKSGEPARIELTVHNTGPHVPPAVAAKLFSKYGQGKDGQRGLGLYFCRLACEAHGGSVRYEASADGPMFVLSLPTGQITPVG